MNCWDKRCRPPRNRVRVGQRGSGQKCMARKQTIAASSSVILGAWGSQFNLSFPIWRLLNYLYASDLY